MIIMNYINAIEYNKILQEFRLILEEARLDHGIDLNGADADGFIFYRHGDCYGMQRQGANSSHWCIIRPNSTCMVADAFVNGSVEFLVRLARQAHRHLAVA